MSEEEKTLLQRIEESPLKNPLLANLAKTDAYDHLHPDFLADESQDLKNLNHATIATTNNVSGNGFDEGNNPVKSSCEDQ